MSSVNNINSASAVSNIVSQPIKKPLPSPAAEVSTRASDRVELSGVSHFLQALKANDIRTDKVSGIKAEIEAGTYDLEGKLDEIADKILEDLDK